MLNLWFMYDLESDTVHLYVEIEVLYRHQNRDHFENE